jgi:hypothetical protein
MTQDTAPDYSRTHRSKALRSNWNKKHFVYEFYDAKGDALYVGCTSDPGRRFIQHSSQPWWAKVADMSMSAYPDREMGLIREAHRIRKLEPLWNIQCLPHEVVERSRGRRADA